MGRRHKVNALFRRMRRERDRLKREKNLCNDAYDSVCYDLAVEKMAHLELLNRRTFRSRAIQFLNSLYGKKGQP